MQWLLFDELLLLKFFSVNLYKDERLILIGLYSTGKSRAIPAITHTTVSHQIILMFDFIVIFYFFSATDTTASESSSATTTASEVSQQSQSETSVTSDMSTTSAESALVTGSLYEEAVTQMVAMGFQREQVQRAMRASFNNPDRAVEYLFNVSN